MYKMAKKRITLSDIAKDTNLSAITISRAFSNPEKVNHETLELVRETAARLGYKPNRAARALKTNKTKTIGIVNPNMSNPFFGNITRSIIMNCRKEGYDVLVFDSYELEEYENNAVKNLIEYSVDGIILSTISTDMDYHPQYIEDLKDHGIPLVLLDRELKGEYNGVYIDNMDSAFQLGKLVADNHDSSNRIDIIAASNTSMVSNNRIAGFRASLYKYDIVIHHASFTILPAYEITKKILINREDNRTPILIGLNNQITLGVIKAVVEFGLRPQIDVKIYSIDDVPYSDIYGLSIPCVTHNLDEIAFQSVNLTLRLIKGEKLVENKVVVRGSLKSYSKLKVVN
jgi:LacI family transcriptional regulator